MVWEKKQDNQTASQTATCLGSLILQLRTILSQSLANLFLKNPTDEQ